MPMTPYHVRFWPVAPCNSGITTTRSWHHHVAWHASLSWPAKSGFCVTPIATTLRLTFYHNCVRKSNYGQHNKPCNSFLNYKPLLQEKNELTPNVVWTGIDVKKCIKCKDRVQWEQKLEHNSNEFRLKTWHRTRVHTSAWNKHVIRKNDIQM